MTTATAPRKASATRDIPLDQLHPAPWNKVRPVDEAFVQSIRDHGQLVTSMARPHPTLEDEYEIVYGHRRHAGLEAAGKETMRC